MIKNYKNYIKEQIDHSELDPFGEEDWDDDYLSPILQITKKQGVPYNQITGLGCSNRQLTSLKGIEKLVNLEELDCSDNQLNSLEGIKDLTNLRVLWCYHNQLINLDEIENLIGLKRLYCSYNSFSEKYINYLIKYCKEKDIYLNI